MVVVMIIPTGIGCTIGGHAGDATPAARLLGSVCDTLILHPNVVNAADINEMPPNALYVEGSLLDAFLEGHFRLAPVRANRILLVANPPLAPLVVNVVAAARVSAGIDVRVVELREPLVMSAEYDSTGRAAGNVQGARALIEQVAPLDFDALAVLTPIGVSRTVAERYFREGGVNPWGGVEAMVSREIATALSKPVAHAPFPNPELDDLQFQCQPRAAAEFISWTASFCILKGLHRAPRLSSAGIGVREVACLVSPYGCRGRPHEACERRGIPVLYIRENQTIFTYPPVATGIVVGNYWEASGYLAAMRVGIIPEAARANSKHVPSADSADKERIGEHVVWPSK